MKIILKMWKQMFPSSLHPLRGRAFPPALISKPVVYDSFLAYERCLPWDPRKLLAFYHRGFGRVRASCSSPVSSCAAGCQPALSLCRCPHLSLLQKGFHSRGKANSQESILPTHGLLRTNNLQQRIRQMQQTTWSLAWDQPALEWHQGCLKGLSILT